MKKQWFFLLLFLVAIFFIATFQYTKKTPNTPQSLQVISEIENTEKLIEDYEVKEEVEVPILIYHHVRNAGHNDSSYDREFIVSPDEFERQMKYLFENNFTSIHIDRLHEYFEGTRNLPQKPVIITFDDGVRNQFTNAYPILKKYKQTATFFVFTNAMDRNENYMTWHELNQLNNAGMLIGSHTVLHPYLTRVNQDRLVEEIEKSKQDIEEHVNTEVTAFSYPFGLYNDFIVNKVKEAGYLVARDILHGKVHSKNDLYKLKARFITEDFNYFKNFVND